MPLQDTTGKLKTYGGNSPEKVFKQHNPQRSQYYSGLGKMSGQRPPVPQYPPRSNNTHSQVPEQLSKGEEYVPKSMLESLHHGLMDMGFIKPYSDNSFYDDLNASDLFDISPNQPGDDPYKNHPMNMGNGPKGGSFTAVGRQPKIDLEPVTNAINNLTAEFKTESATFKLMDNELKKHTEQLKKINVALDKLSQSVQGTALDMPSNIFDRKRGRGLPGSRPTPRPSTPSPTSASPKPKMGGLGDKTRKMLNAAKGIAKRGALGGLASDATIAAGRILSRATPIGLVASAGAGGYAIGSAIANKFGNSDWMRSVGHGMAKVASTFSSEALDAVNTQEKFDGGSSSTNVTTQKTGQVYTPSDPKISGVLDWAAKEFNIPREEVYATAYQESKFDPNARAQSSGGAVGLFQFMESTWNSLLDKYPEMAKKYGIGRADKNGRDDRLDPRKSAVMYGLLRNADKMMLKGASSGNSTTDSYLTHLLGGPAAKKLLDAYQSGDGNDPISKYVSADAINANKNLMIGADGKPLSVNDFLRTIYNKSGSRATAYKEQFDKGTNLPTVGENKKTPEQVQFNSKPTGSQAPASSANKLIGDKTPNTYNNQTTIDQVLTKNNSIPANNALAPVNGAEAQNKMYSALTDDTVGTNYSAPKNNTDTLINSNNMATGDKSISIAPAMRNTGNGNGAVSGKSLPAKPANTQGDNKGSQLAVRNTSSTIQRIFEKDFQLGV